MVNHESGEDKVDDWDGDGLDSKSESHPKGKVKRWVSDIQEKSAQENGES